MENLIHFQFFYITPIQKEFVNYQVEFFFKAEKRSLGRVYSHAFASGSCEDHCQYSGVLEDLGHLIDAWYSSGNCQVGKILGAVLHGCKHILDQAAASSGAYWVVLAGIPILWSLNEIHMAHFNVNSAKSWLENKWQPNSWRCHSCDSSLWRLCQYWSSLQTHHVINLMRVFSGLGER